MVNPAACEALWCERHRIGTSGVFALRSVLAFFRLRWIAASIISLIDRDDATRRQLLQIHGPALLDFRRSRQFAARLAESKATVPSQCLYLGDS
jgi:hypothetical protein